MNVFTLINEVTEEVWVGTTRDDVSPEEKFKQIQDALELGIDHPFYSELREYGAGAFSVNLFAVADDRAELKLLLDEALETYQGQSLAGIKTVRSGTTQAALAPKPRSRSKAAGSKSASGATSTSGTAAPRKATRVVKEKIATGRTGSAARERAIKEAIEAEKAARAAAKAKQIQEEADEMKAILAGLDARGSTLKKR